MAVDLYNGNLDAEGSEVHATFGKVQDGLQLVLNQSWANSARRGISQRSCSTLIPNRQQDPRS